jgi:short chain dehydrogenase
MRPVRWEANLNSFLSLERPPDSPPNIEMRARLASADTNIYMVTKLPYFLISFHSFCDLLAHLHVIFRSNDQTVSIHFNKRPLNMVSLSAMRASNARVATDLPPSLVGIFIGATSGIGETSLKQFAKHSHKPRVYFVGRSQEAGDRILSELKALNPEGSYTFRRADVSLIKVVDEVCREIKTKETTINVLCLSPGVLQMYTSGFEVSRSK